MDAREDVADGAGLALRSWEMRALAAEVVDDLVVFMVVVVPLVLDFVTGWSSIGVEVGRAVADVE